MVHLKDEHFHLPLNVVKTGKVILNEIHREFILEAFVFFYSLFTGLPESTFV